MGLDYGYEMWVPRESLYDLFTRIARLDRSDELSALIWPDGKRLDYQLESVKWRRLGEGDPIPFDDSLDQDFCLSFRFEADEELKRYDIESQEQTRRQRQHFGQPEEEPYTSLGEDGRYSIGCIYASARIGAKSYDWLDGEPDLARVGFTAATTQMSHLFVASPSIRQFFVELAWESGAVSCALDKEENGDEWLFLDGDEIHVPRWAGAHPRELRLSLGRVELTESHRKANVCGHVAYRPSHDEIREVALLTKDADSGVRARAYRVLSRGDLATVLPLLTAGLEDENWRVRAVVAYSLGQLYLPRPRQFERAPQAIAPLIRALRDSHTEVRTVAAGALRYFDDARVFAAHLEIVETTPAIPENLGLLKQSLLGLRMTKTGW